MELRRSTGGMEDGSPHQEPGSRSGDLGEMVEVAIAVAEDEVVLQHQGGDPQIVGRYRRSLAPQLPKESRVVMRRLVVGV